MHVFFFSELKIGLLSLYNISQTYLICKIQQWTKDIYETVISVLYVFSFLHSVIDIVILFWWVY